MTDEEGELEDGSEAEEAAGAAATETLEAVVEGGLEGELTGTLHNSMQMSTKQAFDKPLSERLRSYWIPWWSESEPEQMPGSLWSRRSNRLPCLRT